MKKYILLFTLMLFHVFLPIYSMENKTEKSVIVFIDISGSMYHVFPKIKQAVLDEVFSDIEIGTKLKIYKFYRKLVPIYDGTIKNKADIKYAKSRVIALRANGPWTDIQKVFAYIKEHQRENHHYFIFTDGKHETEDGLHDFELTDAILKEQLGNNVKLIKKNTWKMVDYVYEPVVEQQQPTIMKPPVQDIKEPVKPPIPVEAISEPSLSFSLWWIILIILVVIGIVVIFFILRAKNDTSFYSASSTKTATKLNQSTTVNYLTNTQDEKQAAVEKEATQETSKESTAQYPPHSHEKNELSREARLNWQTRNWRALEKEIQARQPVLTPDQQYAAHKYSLDEGCQSINNYLRYPERTNSYDKYAKEDAEHLRKAIEKTSLPRITLQRYTKVVNFEKLMKGILKETGLSFEDIRKNPNLAKGIIINDPAFLSTSPNANCAFPRDEDTPVKMLIESFEGQKGLYIEPHTENRNEYEIMLPPNTPLLITGGKVTESGELRFYLKRLD